VAKLQLGLPNSLKRRFFILRFLFVKRKNAKRPKNGLKQNITTPYRGFSANISEITKNNTGTAPNIDEL